MIRAQPCSQRRGSLGQSGKWFPQCHSEHHWPNRSEDPGLLDAGPALCPHDALNGSENKARGGRVVGCKRTAAGSRDGLWPAGARRDGCHRVRLRRLPEPVGSDFNSLSVSLTHTLTLASTCVHFCSPLTLCPLRTSAPCTPRPRPRRPKTLPMPPPNGGPVQKRQSPIHTRGCRRGHLPGNGTRDVRAEGPGS